MGYVSMSIGYGGLAVKQCESDSVVYYSYSIYSLSISDCDSIVNNGLFEISKKYLVRAKRHEKILRAGKKKKKQVKLILQDNRLEELLETKQIQIVNNSQCFKKIGEYDFIALRLCSMVLNEYQLTGIMPEQISYNI